MGPRIGEEKKTLISVLAHRNRSDRSDFCDCDAHRDPRNRAISETRERGGGMGPTPSTSAPPRITVRQLPGCWYCVWRVQLFVRLVFAVLSASCVGCESGLSSYLGPAKSRAQLSGVRVNCSA